jgi:cytochrome P450
VQTDLIYNYLAPEMATDPYPAYAELREHAPVYHDEVHDVWALSRYADVQSAFRDWGTFTSAEGVDPDGLVPETGMDQLLMMDPPRHDVIRKLLRDRFTPKAVRALGERTAQLIRPLVAGVVAADRADFAELGSAVAFHSMADFMGMSETASEQLRRGMSLMVSGLTSATGSGPRPFPPGVYEGAEAFKAVMDDELMRCHADEDRDDMTATVAAGERSGLIDRREAISICAVTYFGALDSTAASISITLQLLAEHPDVRTAVVAGEVPLADAFEECIRFHAPVQWVMRTTTRDVELHDRTMPSGARVLLLQGSANRDPRQFERADELDVHRPRQRHFAFGEGVHFCLGAPLARLWATIAIDEVLRHAPDYVPDGETVRSASSMSYGLESLPVRLRP